MAILQDMTTMTHEQMMAEIAALRAANEALKAKPLSKVTLKVSEKGAISLYGLGRFPLTLYATQWERVIGFGDEIKAFIRENKGKLATKD